MSEIVAKSREQIIAESLARLVKNQIAKMGPPLPPAADPRQQLAPQVINNVQPTPVQVNVDLTPVAEAMDRMSLALMAQGKLLASLFELLVEMHEPPPVVASALPEKEPLVSSA